MKNYELRQPIPSEMHSELAAYPELMRSLLFYRGIDTKEKADKFLNPNYVSDVHDPFLLKDMDKAVERIFRAVDQREKILIYSDYDADGIPAAVVLTDFFKLINYDNVEVYIPHRHNEGYGLHLEAIESFKTMGVTLMITLDCGIVDHDEVKRAAEIGIDIIVTDHHVPGETLPDAYAVVNPKRADCEYPFKHLCGAGVAFKLVQALATTPALRQSLRTSPPRIRRGGRNSPDSLRSSPPLQMKRGLGVFGEEETKALSIEERAGVRSGVGEVNNAGLKPGQEKWLLDMVGLATLSDMVPLVGENRVFAHYGLKVLRKSRRPGFNTLLSIINVNKKYVTEDDVGFMITPRINAASRMGIPIDAFHLLSTNDEERGRELASHLDHINNERKGLVAVTVKEIKKVIEDRADYFKERNVIVIGNPLWRPALLGLAANTIAEEFGKPVFLWGREDGKDIKGSCRSDGSVHLVKLMEHVRSHFIEFGGHAFSGGFSVRPDLIHTFSDALNEAFSELGHERQLEEPVRIDSMLSLEDITPELYANVEKLSPFGMDNPKPLFMWKNLTPSAVRMFGKTKDHLELVFADSRGKNIKAVGFFMKADDFSPAPRAGVPLTLIGTLEKSYFGRAPELRVRIVDII